MSTTKVYWKRNWMILTAIVVHGSWGVIVLLDPEALNCTPIKMSPLHYSPWLAGPVYLGATGLALWHVVKDDMDLVGLFKVLPQQMLLMTSAAGAIWCVAVGHYADGVPRPWGFILADQLWNIVGMVAHSLALLDWFYWSRITK